MVVLVDVAFFVAGAAAIFAFVRWWQPEMRLRHGIGHAALALLFWSPGLLSSGHQVATDFAYLTLPFRATAERGLRPSNGLLSDPVLAMLPYRHLVRERLLAGEAPLWAHELGTGQPLLANAQSAPFAPLFLLLLPLPPLRAMEVAVALQTLLGLLLGHALLRRLGASHGAAAFSALAYAFSSYTVAWAFYPLGMSAMWLPGVFLGLVALAQRQRRAFAGLVACAVGLALSGHPETLALGALGAGVTSLVLLARARPGARLSFAVPLLVAPLLAFSLSAPVLLPLLEVLPRSERAALIAARPDEVAPPPFEARLLALALDPLHLGSPREWTWKGPDNFNETATLYAGASVLALALAGALAVRGRALWIVLGGAVAAGLALRIGPVGELLTSLPLLEHTAYGRLRLLWVLAVAVAGGLVLDEAARHRGPGLRRAAATALAVAALGLELLRPAEEAPWSSAWRMASSAGLLLLGLAFAAPRFPSRRLPALGVAVLALDLGLLGVRYNPRVAPELGLGPPLPPSLAFLVRERERHGEPFRVVGEGSLLMPNLASVYGLWDPRSYDPARPVAPVRAAAAALQGEQGNGSLAVRYRLTRPRSRLAAPWTVAFRGPGGRVWRNDTALPLFFFPRTFAHAPSGAGTPRIDGRFAERVLVEGAVSPSPAAGEQRGEAVVRAVSGNGLRVAVSSQEGGVVASSVSWDPGWRLEIDGEPAPIVVIEGAFLGFEVGPGRQVAVFDYSPRSWRAGLALAGMAALATAGVAVWRSRRPASRQL